jgi:pyridoxine 4-dehydrogenase
MNIDGYDVGTVGLGTAPLAFKDVSFEQAVETVRAALDAGIRFIDTALAYSRTDDDSFAEAAVAAALTGRGHDNVLVATKGGHRRVGNDFPIDASPAALRADCERSLSALDVETIDLYQLHHVDPTVPLVDSVASLWDLKSEGKIRLIGLSNVDVGQIKQVTTVAPIASVQNRLALSHHEDLPTAEYCAERGIAYLAYQPLGGVRDDAQRDAIVRVAASHGVSPQRVQLAWLLALPSPVLPLVGASRPQTIADSAAASELRLTDADLRLLGAASPR